MTITLYGPAASSYVRTARMTCVEKGIDHALIPVELGSEAHRHLHPWAKVPILEHGSIRIIETAAICRYLDDAFGGPSLSPRDPRGRAAMEQWISALNCYLYDDLVRHYALQYIFPRGADGKPNREVVDRAIPLMTRDLDAVEQGLDGPWLCGESLTLADLFYGPALFLASLFPEGKEAIASRPKVRAWLSRAVERPAFQKVQPR